MISTLALHCNLVLLANRSL